MWSSKQTPDYTEKGKETFLKYDRMNDDVNDYDDNMVKNNS